MLKKSVDEIKRLQEEVSALRQENLQLKVNRVIKKEITEKARIGNESRVTNLNFSKKYKTKVPNITSMTTMTKYDSVWSFFLSKN